MPRRTDHYEVNNEGTAARGSKRWRNARFRHGLKPHQQAALVLVAFVAAATFVMTNTNSGLDRMHAQVTRTNDYYP